MKILRQFQMTYYLILNPILQYFYKQS